MTWRPSLPLTGILRATLPAGPRFFARATETVARELVGCILVAGDCAGRIVETEAYLGQLDGASHAFPGPTPRNRVMFGPAGYTYVYFIYGMYHCVNFVTEREGVAGAVLLRALEPLCGIDAMRTRRPKAKTWEDLASGPGKLTLAMDIGPRHNGLPPKNGIIEVRRVKFSFRGAPVSHPQDSSVWRPPEDGTVASSPRVGIRKCADWPLRFFEHGNPCVSRSPLNAQARVLTNR